MSTSFLDGMAADHAAMHSESAEWTEPMQVQYPAKESAPTIDQAAFCIFNETYQKLDPETGISVMSSNPAALVYVPAIEELIGTTFIDKCADRSMRLIIRGVNYVVSESQPDGTGCYVLVLKRE